MATIDIRMIEDDEIVDTIVFADSHGWEDAATELKIIESSPTKPPVVRIVSIESEVTVSIRDVMNLIKALQKAQEIWKD